MGVELLLDGVLAADEAACGAFLEALRLGARPDAHDQLAWHALDHPARVADIAGRLLRADLPLAYRDPDQVALRVHRILATRPRLALRPEEVDAVRAWAQQALPTVVEAAPALLAAVLD